MGGYADTPYVQNTERHGKFLIEKFELQRTKKIGEGGFGEVYLHTYVYMCRNTSIPTNTHTHNHNHTNTRTHHTSTHIRIGINIIRRDVRPDGELKVS